ncbi:MAG: AgmX/PglI C-terminal domain-containing protein [Marinagarivorans sp.]
MAQAATLALHRYGLDWQPNNSNDRNFYLIAGLSLGLALVLALVIANTQVPPKPVQTQAPVAPRIVNYMANRPKPVIDIPPPKPKPAPIVAPAKPKLRTEPVPAPVQPQPVQPVESAPNTSLGRNRPAATTNDPNKASARAKAQSTGLLALGNQVASVLDTAPSTQALAQTASTQTAQAAAVSNATDHLGTNRKLSLDANATAPASSTRALDQQAVQASAQQLKQSLNSAAAGPATSGTGRSDKDIAGVFAQNQPGLNSLFERARRQIPGLAGKLVLELNIAADGSVSAVKVLASELNNPELEGKIISRVKLFKFAAGKAQSGVKYAMEFVPG